MTCPCLTERLLMGRKESNQTKKEIRALIFGMETHDPSIYGLDLAKELHFSTVLLHSNLSLNILVLKEHDGLVVVCLHSSSRGAAAKPLTARVKSV